MCARRKIGIDVAQPVAFHQLRQVLLGDEGPPAHLSFHFVLGVSRDDQALAVGKGDGGVLFEKNHCGAGRFEDGPVYVFRALELVLGAPPLGDVPEKGKDAVLVVEGEKGGGNLDVDDFSVDARHLVLGDQVAADAAQE